MNYTIKKNKNYLGDNKLFQGGAKIKDHNTTILIKAKKTNKNNTKPTSILQGGMTLPKGVVSSFINKGLTGIKNKTKGFGKLLPRTKTTKNVSGTIDDKGIISSLVENIKMSIPQWKKLNETMLTELNTLFNTNINDLSQYIEHLKNYIEEHLNNYIEDKANYQERLHSYLNNNNNHILYNIT